MIIRICNLKMFNHLDMTKSMLGKIRFAALKSAAADLTLTDLEGIEELGADVGENEEMLRKIHHVLFEVHLVDGYLICPESSRRFPVKDGIPNMLLHEDEV